MNVITPPTRKNKTYVDEFSIFLAGSTEMGKASDWQQDIIADLEKSIPKDVSRKVTVYNPRRKDWNSSWKQDINEPQFFEQVAWELDRIDNADLTIIYLDPDTKSPISLLELGKISQRDTKCIVCCPKGFWRKGNVDIVCYFAGIPVVTSLAVLKSSILAEITAHFS